MRATPSAPLGTGSGSVAIQMPIRRIMVDWRENGFGKTSIKVGQGFGYYSNAKPFCADGGKAFECKKSDNATFGLTCKGITLQKIIPASLGLNFCLWFIRR